VSAVTIRYLTDPACPPDPARMRLRWQYGDQIAWELRMIVVREQRGSGWPQERGSDATIHACRAIVATGLRWPDRQEAMLRRLQALAQAGELLDDSDTLEMAAEQAGLPVAELAAYCAESEVEAALRADMTAAGRRPCATQEILSGELAWAGMPLATAEVSGVCGRDVRADLARTAQFEPAGYWSL
jgi:predicted DsbA family dithiol-disulfide isomerase